MTAGWHLALMGIDGAGKSTLAVALAEALRGRGREVEIVNFKRAMLRAGEPTSTILAHVALTSLKCQYAEAVPVSPGVELETLLSEADLGEPLLAAERRLRSVPLQRNSPRPFLSSALLEIIGGCWVQAHIESRVRAGVDVIDESYAFKHALKNVLFSQRMSAPGSAVHIAAQGVLDTARSVFGALLQPTRGYWVDADPRLALRWRKQSDEVTTPFEDYGLMGETGDDSFLAMQEDCRHHFDTAARQWGWQHLPMLDRARVENVEHAIRVIEKDAATGW